MTSERKRRVAVVVTARPSYARVKSVLEAVRAHGDLELQVVAGGSAVLEKYGQVASVMAKDGFEPTARVLMVVEGEEPIAMAKTTGLGIIELAGVFDSLMPDVVVTIADRFETIASAVAASYQNIPVAHVQGGEVTGSIDEKVRHAVTKLADLHFPSTILSAERLVRMGERPDRVFMTGCPSVDLAARVKALDHDPPDLFARGVGGSFDLSRPYVIVIQHPVTTEYGHGPGQIEQTLAAVERSGLPTMWFWPNVDAGTDGISKRIRMFREMHRDRNVHFLRNLQPEDFLSLLDRAACIVGNSSVAIREGSYLGAPAVNIGSRQSGREHAANVVTVDHDADDILAAIQRQVEHGTYPSSSLYGDGNAGQRIAQHLAVVDLAFEKKLAY